MPLARSQPYLLKGQYPSGATVARLVRMSDSEIRKEKKSRNSLERIPRANLEGRLSQLHQHGLHEHIRTLDIRHSPIPHIEDHVDLATVDTFLAKKDRGENPVVVILDNTYYSLNYCYERKGKGLRCRTTLLYLWLAVHLFHSKGRMTFPIEDYHWSWVKTMSKAKWAKHSNEATQKSIR
ncbi:hypothetical protein CR513_51748, partial [Mucuna pruriens]